MKRAGRALPGMARDFTINVKQNRENKPMNRIQIGVVLAAAIIVGASTGCSHVLMRAGMARFFQSQ
jgi:hypothetical protein